MNFIINHRLYGEHSGFPTCCVKFYTGPWSEWDHSRKVKHRDNTKLIAGRSIGYIACPNCLKTSNFVPVHYCDPECIKFLNEEVGLPMKHVFWGIFDNVFTGKVSTPKEFLSGFEISEAVKRYMSQVG